MPDLRAGEGKLDPAQIGVCEDAGKGRARLT